MVKGAKHKLWGCALMPALLLIAHHCAAQYPLRISWKGQPADIIQASLKIPESFKTRDACIDYVYRLSPQLQARGFAAVSIDSVRFDEAAAFLTLYLGDQFRVDRIRTRAPDDSIFTRAGWEPARLNGKDLDQSRITRGQETVLNYLENSGYPFGKIWLDSINFTPRGITGLMRIQKGPLYHIDSIRIYGSARISPDYMERYLGIPEGSIYRKEKLQQISTRIRELPFITEEHPWSVSMLGTGSILNLYLKPRRSSQVDVLVGFLPATTDPNGTNKLLVTGEATLNLKNSFGNGESIGMHWDQLQPQSPRLNLDFQQPYIFQSPFGISAGFALYKKDSAYVNIAAQIGVQYSASASSLYTVFLQATGSNLVTVDTLQVVSTRRLPNVADVSSIGVGLSWSFFNTNYRFNPVRGNEFTFTGTVGTKKIRKNPQISALKDPSEPAFDYASLYDTVKQSSYQFRLLLAGAHFFPLSQASTLKLGLNAGLYESGSVFRNELFQIGGYRLLRGFSEESILATQYAVGTLEYRYLIAQNSFLFGFLDGGWAKNAVPGYSLDQTYFGVGLGLAFETKAGIFNISYAIGKAGSDPFSFRQAKIHLGYVNFF